MNAGMTCTIAALSEGEVDDSSFEVPNSTERFLSILDKRRLKRNVEEEAEVEWRPFVKSDAETVAVRVDSLISKLKRQFSEEKQVRMLTLNSSHYQYIFSNSVDSFLRYHEKPKVEIQYSEAGDTLPGEGLYSFAVRPSKIQKRRKDTVDALENVHVTTLSPNKLLGSGTENGHGRFEIKVKCSSTLPSKPDDGTFSGTCRNKVYPVIKTPEFNAFLSKHTAAKDLNSHLLSPDNNTISAFETSTVSGVVVLRTNTMLTFWDVLSTTCSIARASLQYFCLYKRVGTPVILLIHEYDRFEKIYSLFVLQCQRQKTLADISIQAEKYSHTVQSVSKTTPSKEIYGHTVPPACHAFTTTGMAVQTGEMNKNAVYHVNKVKTFTEEICINLVFYLITPPGTAIQMTSTPFTLSEMPSLPILKGIFGHSLAPNPYIYVSSIEERCRCVTTSKHNRNIAGYICDHTVLPPHNSEVRATTEFQNKATSSFFMTATLEKIYRNAVVSSFSLHVSKEIYDPTAICKLASPEQVHLDNFIPSVKDIPVLEYICDSALKINYDNPKTNEVQKTSHDTISDASEDDSAFGILSVYCNSEIHSRYGNISKAEVQV
ncbi:uncharacterized protein LOC128546113 [Mercenaria mercenaria]|uniref:uncharacterized protein LOC128546113 n=1 Tax=Mercenaria mercenaria TaxID=6596 RepID=UPI00234ED699|nr:uncharacterized protein LOC128546113 [Mercenaria mercenaria]